MCTKSWTFQKSANFRKILNHVFKTSKKTLSYSRTYCKIYKIENIGKIGQSTAGLLAKRVIYYGSTRSTLSTPLWKMRPPHFSRWILKFWKNWNYHFWGFFSQNRQKRDFDTFISQVRHFEHYFWSKVTILPKMAKFDTFSKFYSPLPCQAAVNLSPRSTLSTPSWWKRYPHFSRWPILPKSTFWAKSMSHLNASETQMSKMSTFGGGGGGGEKKKIFKIWLGLQLK